MCLPLAVQNPSSSRAGAHCRASAVPLARAHFRVCCLRELVVLPQGLGVLPAVAALFSVYLLHARECRPCSDPQSTRQPFECNAPSRRKTPVRAREASRSRESGRLGRAVGVRVGKLKVGDLVEAHSVCGEGSVSKGGRSGGRGSVWRETW